MPEDKSEGWQERIRRAQEAVPETLREQLTRASAPREDREIFRRVLRRQLFGSDASAVEQSERSSERATVPEKSPKPDFWTYADKAMFGLCEFLALLFGLPFGEDLYHDKPIASISGWHWFYFGIAALFAVTGPMWPWLRTRTWLPAVVAASLSRAPLDARLWLAALLLLFLYGTAPEMYHRATAPIAPTADQIAKATSPIQAKLDEAIKQRDTAKLELDDTKRQLDAARQIAPLGASSSVLIVPSPSLTGPLIGEIASATILFQPGLGEAATLMEKSTNIKTAVVEIDHTVQTTIIGYQPIIGTFVFDGSYGPFDVRVGGGSVFPADTTTIRENGETSVVVQIFPGQALTTIGSSSREIRISFLRK